MLDKKYIVVETNTGIVYAGELVEHGVETVKLSHCFRVFLNSKYTVKDIIFGRDIRGRITNNVESLTVFNLRNSYIVVAQVLSKLLSLPKTTAADSYKVFYKDLCLKEYCGYIVKEFEHSPIAVVRERGRFAKGRCIFNDLSYIEGYTISYWNVSSFANNLHDAFDKLQSMVLNYQATTYKPSNFADFVVSKYPDVDAPIPCLELILLHNKITNSCTDGINEFCATHSINFHKEYSMRYFLTAVKDSYSPERIKSIADKYGIII